MILRPVSPASAAGPPSTNEPLGLTMILVASSTTCPISTGSMTSSRTPSEISFWVALAAWCVDTTIASMRFGLPSSYSTVTWVLPSGRK